MTIKAPTPQMQADLHRLWQQAFGDPDCFIDSFFETAFSPARCLCLLEKEQLAAALYWFDCTCKDQKLAYIYGVATDADFRHRGLCHRLIEATLQHLSDLGYAGAVLVPAEGTLRTLYAHMGFRDFGGITEFTCIQGGEPARLQKLSLEEYLSLRGALMPPAGVSQFGAAMDFLSTYTEFYTGENILFSLSRDGDSAFVAELLGDSSHAPAILQALNIPQGRFRTPGGDPFAMYYPLTEDFRIPAYFGHALD